MSNLAFFVFTMNIGDVIFLIFCAFVAITVFTLWVIGKIDNWKRKRKNKNGAQPLL